VLRLNLATEKLQN